MSAWAYGCRACDGTGEWWVACTRVDEMPAGVDVLRVRVDGAWHCARVDRSRREAVDAALLRDAVASDRLDCPGCAPGAVASAAAPAAAEPTAAPAAPPATDAPRRGMQLQGAAISLAGRRLVVLLVPVALVRSPGEAQMALNDLAPHFAGVDLVLMGQADDGTPETHGDAELCTLLQGVPLDRMPWRTFEL